MVGKLPMGLVTADAMSMQKDIIDKIKNNGADFLIERKANKCALLYGLEYRLGSSTPVISYTEGPELSHGRIETRTYRIYEGFDMIADKDKLGGSTCVNELYQASAFSLIKNEKI